MATQQTKKVVVKKSKKKSGTQAPVLLALTAAVAGFFFWRWKQSKAGGKGKGSGRSAFRFPTAAKAGNEASSSLPRNKASSNKKNKERKREQRERRAEKREQQGKEGKVADKEQPPVSAVFNYSYLDSASQRSRGGQGAPAGPRQGKPTALDPGAVGGSQQDGPKS